jgi:hypothetical protein
MPALHLQSAVLPRPPRLVARLAFVATALLWLTHSCASVIVKPMIPALQAAVAILDDDFRILGMDVSTDGGNKTLRVRADLAHAAVVSGQVLYPISPGAELRGWMEVHLALGGVLQYPLLLLIVVLAWPAKTSRELLARIGIALPLAALLLLLAVPSTILAELWFPIHDDYDPGSFWPLLAWSRFLMGGGGQVLGLLMGITAIVLAPAVTPVARHCNTDCRKYPCPPCAGYSSSPEQ